MEQEIKILSSDVNAFQQLRTSVLFRFIQEISIAHTEELGYRRDKTLDKGALWVISRMSVTLNRPIKYDEHIVLESWPGDMMHFIFPRYYRIRSAEDGAVLMDGAGLWNLIDRDSRSIIMPREFGVIIDGDDREDQAPMPQAVHLPEFTTDTPHDVRFTDIDLNGHVNNTRYFDWFDDRFPPEFHKNHYWETFEINYTREIRSDSTVVIRGGEEDGYQYAAGLADGEAAFAIRAKAAEIKP